MNKLSLNEALDKYGHDIIMKALETMMKFNEIEKLDKETGGAIMILKPEISNNWTDGIYLPVPEKLSISRDIMSDFVKLADYLDEKGLLKAADMLDNALMNKTGYHALYMYSPSTGEHKYLDTERDLFVENDMLEEYGLA